MVGETGDGVQTAHRSRPLDGVECAEELVDDLYGPAFGPKRQSRLLNASQELIGFLEKCLNRVISL